MKNQKVKKLLPNLRRISVINSKEGRVLPPLLLYMLGVPGVVVLLLWIFVFRG